MAYGSFFYFPGYSLGLAATIGAPFAHARYGYGYGYRPYYYDGYYAYPYSVNPASAYTGFVRLKIRPRDAEVWVDGYYVGVVDSFDGVFQRLRLEEGPHRIEVTHPEFVPIDIEVLIVTGETVTLEQRMPPL